VLLVEDARSSECAGSNKKTKAIRWLGRGRFGRNNGFLMVWRKQATARTNATAGPSTAALTMVP
jgi:hypothetical protein